jgi:hypothetical protein
MGPPVYVIGVPRSLVAVKYIRSPFESNEPTPQVVPLFIGWLQPNKSNATLTIEKNKNFIIKIL